MFKTLRTKLLIGVTPLLAILVVLGLWAVVMITGLGTDIDRILRENYYSVRAAQGMKDALERMDSSMLFAVAATTCSYPASRIVGARSRASTRGPSGSMRSTTASIFVPPRSTPSLNDESTAPHTPSARNATRRTRSLSGANRRARAVDDKPERLRPRKW